MIDLLWKTQGRPTSQRYAFILQEKPRSGTRETSLIVKLETVVNFSLERFLYILKKERTQESFLRSKGFFLLHYRKRGRQHVCKDPDSFWGGFPHLQHRLCMEVCPSNSHSIAPEVRSGAQENHKGDYHLLDSK